MKLPFENGHLNNLEAELLSCFLQEDNTKALLGEIRRRLHTIDDDFLSKLEEICKNLSHAKNPTKQATAYKIANILRLIGLVRARQKKPERTTEDFYEIETKKPGDPDVKVDDLLERANFYIRSSELSLAMYDLKRAKEISERLGDHLSLSRCLRGIGIVRSKAGKLVEAMAAHEGELAAAEQAGDLLSQAKAHGNIASILLRQKRDLPRGVRHSRQSLSLYRKAGDRIGEARALNNLGGLYYYLANLDTALEYFTKSQRLKQQEGDLPSAVLTLGNVATIYREKGQLHKAEKTYEEALDLARQIDNRNSLIGVLSQYGLFLADVLHENARAALLLEEALQTLEKLRGKISKIELRENFGREFDPVYHALMSIYQRIGQNVKALEVIDSYKCRTLIEFMAHPVKAAASVSNWPVKEVKFIGQFPLRRIPGRELLASIPKDAPTALVQYALIYNDLFAFLNLPDNPHIVQCIPISNVNYEMLSRFLIEYDEQNGKPIGGLFPLVHDYNGAKKGAVFSSGIPQEEMILWAYLRLVQGIPDLLARLGDAIFAPIAPLIRRSGAKRILFVPTGVLYYFPLQAMSWKVGESRRYVIDDYDVFFTPNLRAFQICCQTPSPKGGKLIGLANPDGSLPASEKELRIITKMFKDSICFFGKDANLSAISSNADQCSIFHAATHSLLNPVSAGKSGLILAKDPLKAVKVDRQFVTATGGLTSDYNLGVSQLLPTDSAFAKLRLPQGVLVVLSACETATILPNLRENYTGLTGAFLINGAGSVLSSFWPVDDLATCLTMVFFYQKLKKSNNLVHSLNQSQRKIRSLTREAAQNISKPNGPFKLLGDMLLHSHLDFSNPFYWAAFGMFGKPML